MKTKLKYLTECGVAGFVEVNTEQAVISVEVVKEPTKSRKIDISNPTSVNISVRDGYIKKEWETHYDIYSNENRRLACIEINNGEVKSYE